MSSRCLSAVKSWVLEEEGPFTAPGHTVPLAGLARVPAASAIPLAGVVTCNGDTKATVQ